MSQANPSRNKFTISGLAVLSVVLFCLPVFLFALPEGESVVAGSATFDRAQDNTLNINTPSEQLIVNYNSFNIAANEAVRFNQPSASSIALNRVVGVDPSSIMGTMSANGRVFLINPNGVIFGAGSRVDVAALVASTLDITNEDFLAGKYNFFKSGENGFIINQGSIIARPGGYICLLSGAIDNQMIIQADLGSVVLAAGEKMTLALDEANDISVVIDEAVKEEVFGPDGQKFDSAIKNSGLISANGGKVLLTAKILNRVFDYAINNTGIIEASNLVEHDGVVELVAEGAPVYNIGKIEAGEVNIEVKGAEFVNKGEIITNGTIERPNGGQVEVRAVQILQQGLISANAQEAGTAGEIIIVSDSSTTLDNGSTTEARALGIIGNGGRILIDSTGGNTTVNNTAVIDVSAGAISGNAGFVEINAFGQLGFYGVLNGRAPPGYAIGRVLIDPNYASISGTFNADTTIDAWIDITIVGDITLGDGVTLNLYADHQDPQSWDVTYNPGTGAIYNAGDYVISAAEGATNTTLNLKAASGIANYEVALIVNVDNLSAENTTSGDICIYSSSTRSLNLLGIINAASGGSVGITSGGGINVVYSLISAGDISIAAYGNIYLNYYADISAPSSATVELSAQTGAIAMYWGPESSNDLDVFEVPGLVGYWSFDEGSGSVTADWSGSGHNGIIYGTPVWVEGIDGYALSFDGSTNYVDVGSNLSLGSNPFTIVLWYKGTQIRPWVGLAGTTDSTGMSSGYVLQNHNGYIQSWVNHDFDSGSLINNDTDTWHQLVMTRNGTVGSLYIDGLLDSTFTTSSASVDVGHNFWIGGWGNMGRLAAGLIDEVGVYNVALTPQEILTQQQYFTGMDIPAGTGKISGGNVILVAATGIDVDLQAVNLQAANMQSGNIHIDNTGDLNIVDILGGDGGLYNAGSDIDIWTSSNLYINTNIVSAADGGNIILSAGSGDIVVTGSNSEDYIDIHSSISGATGATPDNISFYAGNDIILTYAEIASFSNLSGNGLNATTGSIYLQAGRNIVLNGANVCTDADVSGDSSASAGDVTLMALGGDLTIGGYSLVYSRAEVINSGGEGSVSAYSGDIFLYAGNNIVLSFEEALNAVYSEAINFEETVYSEVVSGAVEFYAGGNITFVNAGVFSFAGNGDYEVMYTPGSTSYATSGAVNIVCLGNMNLSGYSEVYSEAVSYSGFYATATSGDVDLEASGSMSISISNSVYSYASVSWSTGQANLAAGEVTLLAGGNMYLDVAEGIYSGVYGEGTWYEGTETFGNITLAADGDIELDSDLSGYSIYVLADADGIGGGSLYIGGNTLTAYYHYFSGANAFIIGESTYDGGDQDYDGIPNHVYFYLGGIVQEWGADLITPGGYGENLRSLSVTSTASGNAITLEALYDGTISRQDYIKLVANNGNIIAQEGSLLEAEDLSLYAYGNINGLAVVVDSLDASAYGSIDIANASESSLTLSNVISYGSTVDISTDGDLYVGYIYSPSTVTLTSGGSMYGSSGLINIVARVLYLEADWNIGTDGVLLSTQVSELYVYAGGNIGWQGDGYFGPGIYNYTNLTISEVGAGTYYYGDYGYVAGGDIVIGAAGNITVGSIFGPDDEGTIFPANNVFLQASGSIMDDSIETTAISANYINLTAGQDIGSLITEGDYTIPEMLAPMLDVILGYINQDEDYGYLTANAGGNIYINEVRPSSDDFIVNIETSHYELNSSGTDTTLALLCYYGSLTVDTSIDEESKNLSFGAGGGDININAPVTTSGDLLQFAAYDNVNIDDDLSSGSQIVIWADYYGDGSGVIDQPIESGTIGSGYESLILSAGSDINITNAEVSTLQAITDYGSIDFVNSGDLFASSVTSAGESGIEITTYSNLTVGFISAYSVTLNAYSGAIIDGNEDSNNVSAVNLYLYAVSGIGSTDALETQVSRLIAQNESEGNIGIINTGDLYLEGEGSLYTSGNIEIGTDSNLFVYADLSAQSIILLADADASGEGDLYVYGYTLTAYSHSFGGANHFDLNEILYGMNYLYFDNENNYAELAAPDEGELLSLEVLSTSEDSIVVNSAISRQDYIGLYSAGDITLNAGLSAENIMVLADGSIIAGGDTGAHIIATSDTLLGAGDIIASLATPLEVSLSGGELSVAIGGAVEGFSGALAGTTASGTVTLVGTPPGTVYFNDTQIWPAVVPPDDGDDGDDDGGDEDQEPPIEQHEEELSGYGIAQLTIQPVTPTPDLDVYQVSTLTGGVFFYHPLTETDMAAFEAIAVGADDYQLTDGVLSLTGNDSLLEFFQQLDKQDQEEGVI